MASSQLTASSISTRNVVASFEGLRPVQFHCHRHVTIGNPARRSFKGLVVKAATAVAPKVFTFIFYRNEELKIEFFLCGIW
jgi:chaperonin GroES